MDPSELAGRTVKEVVTNTEYTVLKFTDGSEWRMEIAVKNTGNWINHFVTVAVNSRLEHPAD